MKENKNNKSIINILIKSICILMIAIISIISFVGIYKNNGRTMDNMIPDYNFGMELSKLRNVSIMVDEGTETKYYDSEGNEVENPSEEEMNTLEQREIPVNGEEVLKEENYQKARDIVEQRFKYVGIQNYYIRLDNKTGKIVADFTENEDSDYMSQYMVATGDFKITDAETGEILLSKEDISKANEVLHKIAGNIYTTYLNIEFNKEGAKKLENISRQYTPMTNSDGEKTDKKVKLELDGSEITTMNFEEPITNGVFPPLSVGSTGTVQEIHEYRMLARNMAVLIGTDTMPVKYTLDSTKVVFSDLSTEFIKGIAIIGIIIVIVEMIALIVKYKSKGVFASILVIGFIASLLILLRTPGNVVLEISGLVGIATAIIMEFGIVISIINANSKKKEDKFAIQNTIINLIKYLFPILIVIIIFSLITKTSISSLGLVMFWAMILMVIYNFIFIAPMLIDFKKNKKSTKKGAK